MNKKLSWLHHLLHFWKVFSHFLFLNKSLLPHSWAISLIQSFQLRWASTVISDQISIFGPPSIDIEWHKRTNTCRLVPSLFIQIGSLNFHSVLYNLIWNAITANMSSTACHMVLLHLSKKVWFVCASKSMLLLKVLTSIPGFRKHFKIPFNSVEVDRWDFEPRKASSAFSYWMCTQFPSCPLQVSHFLE